MPSPHPPASPDPSFADRPAQDLNTALLAAHGLADRWRGARRFTLLDADFGQGHTVLALWRAWLDDPEGADHLFVVALESLPLQASELATPPWPAPLAELAQRLAQSWPARVAGWHTLSFEHRAPVAESASAPTRTRRMTLQYGIGDRPALLTGLLAQVDALVLHGAPHGEAPAPEWVRRLDRLAAPRATLSLRLASSAWRDALVQAGFQCAQDVPVPQPLGLTARFAPRHSPPPQPGGLGTDLGMSAAERHALVVGAGMAGCAAAWALTQQGWRVTLLDRHPHAAGEASGNPGGLFHAIVHAQEGIHARAHRHAALQTAALVSPWIAQGSLAGSVAGLLRLEPRLDDGQAHALCDSLGLPPEHLRWLSLDQARLASGVAVPSGGWLMGQAGWLCPADYTRQLQREAMGTGLLTWVGHAQVHALDRLEAEGEAVWVARDAEGRTLAAAPTVVLANANDLNRLLPTLPPQHSAAPLPLSAIRGQISRLAPHEGLHPPKLPVAGGGYALTLPEGQVLCGATTLHHDHDPSVRERDHRHNLQQARRLGVLAPAPEPVDPGATAPTADPALAHVSGGRVGWRASTPDRLPLVGALPWSLARIEQLARPPRQWQERLIPRLRDAHGGLYVISGLGSRGITWAALSARLLCHWVTGTPCPVPRDIRDALDPARFLCREAHHPPGRAKPDNETLHNPGLTDAP